VRCASCGTENPAGFRFCGNCGAAVAEPAPQLEARKVVTVLFCDLSGSTALGHTTDPEALRAKMRDYYERMRSIVERHGGTVEKFVGDAVMAVFGIPVAHEDDALRAVRAAWEMRSAVPELGLEARIGVNTGEVVTGEGDTLVTGDAVNVAARLEQAAAPGEVLVGEKTRRLVRDAVGVERVEVSAKGKPGTVPAFRLLDVDPTAAAVARRFDTPLVGREAELEQLHRAFERTVREQRCHLFTLLGAAGVGKSRLVAEFVHEVDARVVEGRCLDYGEGITFWPIVSVLKQLGERAEATIARLDEGASSPNELFWAVRTQLEEVARDRPLVVCLDDIQWGEPTFLDLVDHVADLSRGAPIFLLCLARPELLDQRPGWGGGKLNATTILLEPLSTEECERLIDEQGGVEPGLRERILRLADGNPLFVEETIAFARESGRVEVPSTVQALLQARLDQLGGRERAVVQGAAVEGQVFHRGTVLELADQPAVDEQLAALVRKELIHPAPATLPGDQGYRFRHLLIRDAAYDALPKETRADLHERFATWLEAHGAELFELDEIAGYHLEQAARNRRELDRPRADLEGRAARRLAAAGLRAVDRADVDAANNLLGRAVALLPVDDPSRTRLIVERLAALVEPTRAGVRRALLDELEPSEDPALRLHLRLARELLRQQTDMRAAADDERTLDEALQTFGDANDDLGLAHAHLVASWRHWGRSNARDTLAALELSFEHAARAHLHGLSFTMRPMRIAALTQGPFTAADVEQRIAPLRARGSLLEQHLVLLADAHLARLAGRHDEALAFLSDAGRLAGNLGLTFFAIAAATNRAEVLYDDGRLREAAEQFRAIDEEFERTGLASFRSTVLIQLARALEGLDELDEAERFAELGEELGGPEDVINVAWGRAVRARVAAARGHHDAAAALAHQAVAAADTTDFPQVRGDAREALAYVLHAAGRDDDARRELEQALELWRQFDRRPAAERVERLLAEL